MTTPTPAAQALIEKFAAVSMDANPDDLLTASTNFLMMNILAANATKGQSERELIQSAERIAETLVKSVKQNKNFFRRQ